MLRILIIGKNSELSPTAVRDAGRGLALIGGKREEAPHVDSDEPRSFQGGWHLRHAPAATTVGQGSAGQGGARHGAKTMALPSPVKGKS